MVNENKSHRLSNSNLSSRQKCEITLLFAVLTLLYTLFCAFAEKTPVFAGVFLINPLLSLIKSLRDEICLAAGGEAT